MANEASNTSDTTRTVPVLDLHLKEGDTVGNPYRRYDKRAEQWRPLTTREAWVEHPNPHVLPINGDYDGERIVPVTEFDGELPVTPDVLKESDEPTNEFDCPNCGVALTGYPEMCPNCEANFAW